MQILAIRKVLTGIKWVIKETKEMNRVVAVSALLVLGTVGCTTLNKMTLSMKENPIPASEKNLVEAKALFAQHCVSCHGPEANGKATRVFPETPDLRGLRDKKDGVFAMYILYGKNENMPEFREQLSEQQAFSLVHYLRRLGK